ncbi:MAG: GNAT family N-acetyltransferase [Verrucomicrobiaceae bacterium]|nr:GNAT family N-acetyltransferase [Verrucomicrobiaceae bacterium]
MFSELTLPQCSGRLRPIQMSDLDDLVRCANNASVARFLMGRFPHPYTGSDGRSFLEKCASGAAGHVFAIEIRSELVGTLGLRPGKFERSHTCHFGYWLAEPFWGRGIMTEAVRLVSDRVLRDLEFHRMETEVYSLNERSIRVLEKAGFVMEGRLRDAVICDGKFYDDLIFARLRN